jgi:BCD family chlorophyll transporter-like MFS transporter
MKNFGWFDIFRLGLVQAALGSVVVLTTSTLNRVMVVELALPALLPGVLVAWHYLVQVARPRMGYGSDLGARRTPWIIGGMAVLALGGVTAALATVWMGSDRPAGIALALLGFSLIGLGVSASGTSLLVLLAKRVAEKQRAAAATIVWMMMIAGFAITAGVAGHLLDPYSTARLLVITTGVSVLALLITCAALFRLEGAPDASAPPMASPQTTESRRPAFRQALSQVWKEPVARQFTVFVFVSMLAYSAQDLILEPFAGAVFGFTPGGSTRLSGLQHGGVLAGMLLVAVAGTLGGYFPDTPVLRRFASLRGWTVAGCLASALALAGLVAAGLTGPGWPIKANVFALGVANGVFSIGAISSMMRLASEGRHAREGVRMGLWGAAQAVAFGLGGLLGTAASDLARMLIAAPGDAYAAVFGFEALMFVASAALAWHIGSPGNPIRNAVNGSPTYRAKAGDALVAAMEHR